MKALRLIGILGLAAACILSASRANAQEKAAPAAEAAKPAAPATPVMVDAAFVETLGDYQMILREIERIEAATGTVEIPVSIAELRQRAAFKLAKLRAWMKEHGVGEDWSYDAARRSFLPPAAAVKGADRRP
ncbi:MAG: hypothetical protein LAN84_15615 [Acidobacteriia bacterium]|nr:hypothetical protein [Terriglobia bacterium]